MAEKKINGFDKYEIESAARTLTQAIEIRKKPKLFALAKKEAMKQAKLSMIAAQEKAVNAKIVSQLPKKP